MCRSRRGRDRWPGFVGAVLVSLVVVAVPPGAVATPDATAPASPVIAPAVDDEAVEGANSPPGVPVLLVPADGAELRRFGNEPFRISAHDPNGDPYTGTITIRRDSDGAETSVATSPARSGGVSYGVTTEPLTEGSYRWWAEAADVHGAASEPSSARTFTIGPPPTAGGGAAVGLMTFAPPGVPPGSCEPSSSALSLGSTVAVFNTALVGYVGPVEFDGVGTSDCESGVFATGELTVSAEGTSSIESTLSCDALSGSYIRAGTELFISLTGGCVINDFPISDVALTASLRFVPEDPRDGVTRRLEHATLAGAFTVLPQ